MYYVLLVVTAVTYGRYSFKGTSEYLRISTCLFRIEVRSRFRSICFRFLEVIYRNTYFPQNDYIYDLGFLCEGEGFCFSSFDGCCC